ncbi:MAG: hypothetical protein Ct9H300mP14_08450 [Gammaproteobacteria bacterium]|nr:MAG: hypothetical protein Ct9H300mP14_08450 [Gammaproteobacteria bacterium]
MFAGDLITLFSVLGSHSVNIGILNWANRNERAYRAGLRYLVIQIGSGVLLLSGILFYFHGSGSLLFTQLIGPGESLATAGPGVWLIFLAFGIKCAFPLLHNWLQDAYPQATITGAVFLSAFTPSSRSTP